ncbi:proteasome subunit alpha type-7-1-like [Spodoptera frugiperda]|uniref:Proteasome subunit alpha type-7-1-like n=1 Tax=Spodoptera frugiperda TaxID=7108 RepID=A0A9R0DG79_SPOFR|nr:proteasome subunit alpha type-7-1-like [Spodoptera frugiperda]
MARYDRAITVFSPDGQLLQVQYAQEAVRKGSPVVGIRGPNVIILAVERKSVEKLQDERTEKKIVPLDDHVVLAFAGLRADARVLISRAQIECQSHRLTVEDPVSIEYITRYIAEMKQSYTQSNGRRPFGISCLVGGFDYDGQPHLFQTEPSGIYYEWKATTTGKYDKTAREYLEKYYNEEAVENDDAAMKLAIRTILEVVHSGQRNLDVAVIKRGQPVTMLEPSAIQELIAVIDKENAEAENR